MSMRVDPQVPMLTENALTVLKSRYLDRNESGVNETPWQLFSRVARAVAMADPESQRGVWADKYLQLMLEGRFMPNSPTLMNAGRRLGMLSACFVLPVPDTIEGIFKSIGDTALIQRAGGGVGYAFDTLRPCGAFVSSSGGKSSGPLAFWRVFSETTSAIQQGAFRRGANMAIMRSDYPDILKFLFAKQDLQQFTNFNISVKVADNAMERLHADPTAPHITEYGGKHWLLPRTLVPLCRQAVMDGKTGKGHPRDLDVCYGLEDLIPCDAAGKPLSEDWDCSDVVTVGEMFELITQNAWQTGEPGLFFIDRVRETEATPHVGRIGATNPCVVGDTLVAVADGRGCVPIRQLAQEGKDVLVHCVNPANGIAYIRQGRNPRMTQPNADVFKVTLDDGSSITVTEDHKFIDLNGNKIQTKDLQPGTALRRFSRYQQVNTTAGKYYWYILTAVAGSSERNQFPEHSMICRAANGDPPDDDLDYLPHHINEDSLDNRPENLKWITRSDHNHIHPQIVERAGELNPRWGTQHTDSTKELIGQRTVERFGDDEFRNKHSAAVTAVMNDPEIKERTRAARRRVLDEGRGRRAPAPQDSKTCEHCGNTFTGDKAALVRRKYCSQACKYAASPVHTVDLVAVGRQFVEKFGHYPSVSSWAAWPERPVSHEIIRQLGGFTALTEKLIDAGVFAVNTGDWTPKILAAAMVAWMIKRGRTPAEHEAYGAVATKKTFRNNGGYAAIVAAANEMCAAHAVNHKVVSVESAGKADVYNITVDEFHTVAYVTDPNGTTPKVGNPAHCGIYTMQCGEQPLLENEACVLGSIALSQYITPFWKRYNFAPDTPLSPTQDSVFDDAKIYELVDWERLGHNVYLVTRFLDNVVSVNNYPTPEIDKLCKSNRKIGLGIMGLADALIALGVKYDSPAGLRWAAKLMEFVNKNAVASSEKLAQERGAFANFEGNARWTKPMRNACVTTVAPTGTISIIANCSGGVEPLFSFVFIRKVLNGQRMLESHKYFEELGEKWAFLTEPLKEQMLAKGSLQDRDVPDVVKLLFRTAQDVSPEWHVRMQAAVQEHVTSATSKTINMPSTATVEDVREAYLLAWKLKCKGVTVYRDGCRSEQPMSLSTSEATHQLMHGVAPKVEPEPFVEPVELPDYMCSLRTKYSSAFGNMHLHFSYERLPDGRYREREVFCQVGRNGDPRQSDFDALSRQASIILRLGGRFTTLIEQLKGHNSAAERNRFTGAPTSAPNEFALALLDYYGKVLPLRDKSGLLTSLPTDVLTPAPAPASVGPNGHNGNGNGNWHAVAAKAPPMRMQDNALTWMTRVAASAATAGQRKRSCPTPGCPGELVHGEGCSKCLTCGQSSCS